MPSWCVISLSLFSLVVCIVEVNLDTILVYTFMYLYQEYSINSIIATILSRRNSKNKFSLSLSLSFLFKKKKSPPSLPYPTQNELVLYTRRT